MCVAELYPGGMPEGRMPSGQVIEWVADPYTNCGPFGEPRVVRPGDRGRVLEDDWPIELVVTFPATGAFCCTPDEVRPVSDESPG